MRIIYAIHKSIQFSAQEIEEILTSGHDVPGGYEHLMDDGWIIVDNRPNVEPWSRNKEDYRIEFIEIGTAS